MPDVLLSLTMPTGIAQDIEDLLLAHPELVPGFTTIHADGHGSAVRLVEPAELVRGHSPRVQVRLAGDQADMEAVLDLVRRHYPHGNIFYWMVPVLALGRIL